MRSLIAVAFALAPATAAPVPKELNRPKPDDRARLAGAWVVEQCIADGQDVPIEITAMRTIVFDGKDGMRETRKGVTAAEFDIVLDPDASPKRMVWREKGAADKSECTYALTADGLTICTARLNKPPPLSVEPGPNVTVRKYKRAEAK